MKNIFRFGLISRFVMLVVMVFGLNMFATAANAVECDFVSSSGTTCSESNGTCKNLTTCNGTSVTRWHVQPGNDTIETSDVTTYAANSGEDYLQLTAITSSTTVTCARGKYLVKNAVSSTGCTTCPAGHWCPGGTWNPQAYDQGKNACPSGTYRYGSDQTSESTACRPCSNTAPANATFNTAATSSTCPWTCNSGYTKNSAGTACVGNTYTIVFNNNGGSGGQTTSKTVTYGSAMPTPITTPTRTGYAFAGYYDTSAATGGTQYYALTGGSARTWDKTSSATLYARWKPNTYSITLDAKRYTSSTATDGTSATTDVSPTKIYEKYNTGWYRSTITVSGNSISSVTIPTLTGYTFGGFWTGKTGTGTQVIDSSGNIISGKTATFTSNSTLYAKWEPNKYKITVKPNGATSHTSDIIFYEEYGSKFTNTSGGTITTLPGMTRTGYAFKGFYTAASGGTQVMSGHTLPSNTTFTSDTTLYAQWAPVYTITLNYNDGSNSSTTINEVYGEKWTNSSGTPITNFGEPYHRLGYEFDGWYTAASGGIQVIPATGVLPSNTTFTSNTTLYAHWRAMDGITVDFLCEDGSTPIAPSGGSTILQNFTCDDIKTPMICNGRYVEGWTDDYYVATVTNSDLCSIIDDQNRGCSSCYVVYTATVLGSYVTSTVTLNANGGSGGTSSVTATYGSAMPTITTPTLTGYTFAGYYDTSAATGGTQYYTSTGASARTWNKTSATTLYARWTPVERTVTFNANGGAGTMATQTFTYGVAQNLTANTFTRSGYTFAGWNTAANGTGTAYADKATISNLLNNITLYAQWSANCNKITVDDFCSPLDYAPTLYKKTDVPGWYSDSSCNTALTKVSLPDKCVTSKSYTFRGLYSTNVDDLTADGNTGTQYFTKSGDTTTAGTNWTVKAPQTIYVGWATDCDLSDTNATCSVSVGDTGAVDYTTSCKSGYTINSSTNNTYKPTCTGNTIIVDYNENGGTAITNGSCVYGDTLKLPLITRNGFTFKGWKLADDTIVPANSSVACTVEKLDATSDVATRIIAQWTKDEYTITYNLNGGTNNASNPAKYSVDTDTITLADASKTGYTFGGWYSDANFTTKVTQITKGSTGNKTFWAKWTIMSDECDAGEYLKAGETSCTTCPAGYACAGGTFSYDSTKDQGINACSGATQYQNQSGQATCKTVSDGYYKKDNTAQTECDKGYYCKNAVRTQCPNGGTTSTTTSDSSDDCYKANMSCTVEHGSGKTTCHYAGTDYTNCDPCTVDTCDTGYTVNTNKDACSAIKRTVTFNANGGNGTMATQTFIYGVAQNLTANAFTRTGYTFNGWNTVANGSGTAYADKASISNLLSDITLYAQWEQNQYIISYACDYGDGTAPSQTTCDAGTECLLANSTCAAPAGYMFSGWKIGNNTIDNFTDINTVLSAGTYTATAQYEEIEPEFKMVVTPRTSALGTQVFGIDDVQGTFLFDCGNGESFAFFASYDTSSITPACTYSKYNQEYEINIASVGNPTLRYTNQTFITRTGNIIHGTNSMITKLGGSLGALFGGSPNTGLRTSFSKATNLTEISPTLLDGFNKLNNTSQMFSGATALTTIPLNLLTTKEGTCRTYTSTSKATRMFIDSTKLSSVTDWDGNVTDYLPASLYERLSICGTVDQYTYAFSGTALAGTCPAGMYEVGKIGGKPACAPCPSNSSSEAGATYCTCYDGYNYNGGTTTTTEACVVNQYTITLNMNGGTANGAPEHIYEKPNYGWYGDEDLTQKIDNIGSRPLKNYYVFDGFFTEQNGTGTQVIASDGRIIAPNFLFNSDTTIYAYYNSCECTPGDGVSSCTVTSAEHVCQYKVICNGGYSDNGNITDNGGATTYTIFGNFGVAEYTATCKKIGVTTGYTCPADSTKYISCFAGNYMATMDASGNYVYNGTPTVNNSCQLCPDDAAYCPGGTSAPLYAVTLDAEGLQSEYSILLANVNAEYYKDLVEDEETGNLTATRLEGTLPAEFIPTAPVGKTFNGYWTQSQGGEQYIDANGNFLKGPSADVTLYAQWEQNQYIISYACDYGDGTAPSQTTCDAGTECLLANSTCAAPAGYMFSGWKIGNNTIDNFTDINTVLSAGTYTATAQYEEIEPEFKMVVTPRTSALGTQVFGIDDVQGTFLFDCGNGESFAFFASYDTSSITPACTYSKYNQEYEINIASVGNPTLRDTNQTFITRTGNIIHGTNSMITKLGGSLGALFGGHERVDFSRTFASATNLTEIEDTLLDGFEELHGAYAMFSKATKLPNIPLNLLTPKNGCRVFLNGAKEMFISSTKLSTVTDWDGNETSYLPASLYERLSICGTVDQYTYAFYGTALADTCPAGMYEVGKIGGKPACAPCPSNSSSTAGATSCTCNDGYNYDGGTTTTTNACVPNQYTITLNDNGGTGGSGSIIEVYDDIWASANGSEIDDVAIPTRTGYTFTGYYTTDGAKIISENGVIIAGYTTFTENTTLYAQWAPIYTITLNYNYGSNSSTTIKEVYGLRWTNSSGTAITYATFPTRAGYTFNGYYTAASGGTQKIPASGLLPSNTTFTANTNLYAQWTLKTFDNNGFGAYFRCADGSTPIPSSGSRTSFEGGFTCNDIKTPMICNGRYVEAWEDDIYYAPLTDSDLCFVIDTLYNECPDCPVTFTAYELGDAVTYTITYDLDGGTNNSSNPTTYNVDTSTITLVNPTKTGYTFGGWYTNSGFTGTAVTSIPKGSTGNKTLYAKWTQCAAGTYEKNGTCTPCAAGTFSEAGATACTSCPAGTTTKSTGQASCVACSNNANVDSWNNSGSWNSGTNATVTTCNIKACKNGYQNLSNACSVITYNIKYYDASTELTNLTPKTYNITSDTITLATPTKTGYTFAGWYSDANFTTKATQIAKGSTGNKTLYVKWSTDAYTITYNLDGGENNVSNPYSYDVTSDTITLANPTKTGYTFGGWYSDASFTTKVIQIAKGSTGNKTFWAKWTKNEYTITYNLDGGTNATSNPAKYSVDTATIILATPTKTGYTFGGWYDNSGLTGTAVKTIVTGSTGNKTFWAKWTTDAYTITYNLNGGVNAESNPAKYSVDTDTITLANATKTGYTFGGWYSDANFTTKVTQIAKGSTGDKTFWAKWTTDAYTITYNLNGGTNHASNPDSYDVTTATITLANATKTGYTFGGWYSDANFTTKVTQIATGSTGNKTLYAKWTIMSDECDAGEYLKAGETSCTTCPVGYACAGGTFSYDSTKDQGISACSGATQYQNQSGQATCKTVSDGYYKKDNTAQTECGNDYYCKNAVRTQCPNGYVTDTTTASLESECYTACTVACTEQTCPENAKCSHGTTTTNGKQYVGSTCNAASSTCDITISCNNGYDLDGSTCVLHEYTITYELDGGVNNASNPDSYDVTTDTITLADASKTGYTFGGWYSDANFTTKVTQIVKGSTGNITLYAKWIIANCDDGYYKPSGNHACTICPKGSYCVNNKLHACPDEYTTSGTGASQETECFISCSNKNVEYGIAHPDASKAFAPSVCTYTRGTSITGNPCDIIDGVCVETSCKYNYEMKEGKCTECVRDNALSFKQGNGNCVVESCIYGFHPSGKECVPAVKECDILPINALSAAQSWNTTINAYDTCKITECVDGYHIDNNVCISDTQTCELRNGTGKKTWNHALNKWDECIAEKCYPGYTTNPDLTNETWEQCGKCSNAFSDDGEEAVSSYIDECEILFCKHSGEKYILENNECRLICNEFEDETGSRYWDSKSKKCVHTCNAGYKEW